MIPRTSALRRARATTCVLGMALLILAAAALAIGQVDSASAKNDKKDKGKVDAKIEGTTLIVTGSQSDDEIVLQLAPGDSTTLLVVVPSNPASNRDFKRDKFESIRVDAGGGDDTISVDETAGVFTDTEATTLNGEAGNDTLFGGFGPEALNGGGGNDSLFGRGGVDVLSGGDDNDTLTGGDGDDFVYGGAGDDTLVWNPGDDSDVVEGEDGTDTVQMNGGNGAEIFSLTANGTRVRFDRVSPAPFVLDIGTSEQFELNANGGNDEFSATGNLAALIQVTVDGGAGNDILLGTNGADLLLGGDDNDTVDGQQGNDVALLGAGDDTFRWDPGDGSDVVEGQTGSDTLLFNGSNASESIDILPNGARVRLFRNIGNVNLDLDDVEAIDLNSLGGADTTTIGDHSATDLTSVDIDLAAVPGTTTGDAAADAIIVSGTAGDDGASLTAAGSTAILQGLPVAITIATPESAFDTLAVALAGGSDTFVATGNLAALLQLTVNGGPGNDTILGSNGVDVLLGGDDNDLIDGNQGNDAVFLGDGDDTFQWDPGDGSDTIEGQSGADTLLLNGSNANEIIDVSANGGRVRFFRNVANIVLDIDDVETLNLNSMGGADEIAAGDLTPTDVTAFNVNLAGVGGIGDGQADTVTVNGTAAADVISVSGAGPAATVTGLSATVTVANPEAANDTLLITSLAGADTVDASGLAAGIVKLSLNGGLDADVLIGSQGNDFVVGGDGDDLALLGAGDDTFAWNPGDDNDVVEGQAGFDTLVFAGSNAAENVDISANGGRIRIIRNVASVTMDLDDIESILFRALGGADVVSVNDLSGTDVVEVDADLAAFGGGGDVQADTVIVYGTNGDDVILVAGDASGVAVFGLAAQVNITGAEAAFDRLVVYALAGDDVVDASALGATGIQLTADGGDDNDVLIGGDGNDVLLGGDGDDVLLGGPGIDILDGGAGTNIVIQ